MIINKEKIDLNIRFNGSYELLKWVIQRYKDELPYRGYVSHFAISNNYLGSQINHWSHYGVGYRVWNLLNKDLTIAYLMGKIELISLFELEKIYKELNNN